MNVAEIRAAIIALPCPNDRCPCEVWAGGNIDHPNADPSKLCTTCWIRLALCLSYGEADSRA